MKFILRLVPINRSGYDRRGKYFGVGQSVYWYEGAMQDSSVGYAEYVEDHIRADDREHAILKIKAKYPDATFYRGLGKSKSAHTTMRAIAELDKGNARA